MNKFIAILVMAFVAISIFPKNGYSQQNAEEGIWFDVMRVFPTPTLKRDTLEEAKTIVDLNKYYKPIWIREFVSVEVSTINDGETNIAIGKNDVLTEEQKTNMETADALSEIFVIVKYMPENTLKNNEPKTFDFSFSVDAEKQASCAAGKDQLIDYIREKAVSKIDSDLFEGKYNIAAVKFAIDIHGQVVDAHVFESSNDEKVDKLLLETICDLPAWAPATFANGLKTQQEFVLAVGNKESCSMNLLYVKQ